MEFRSLYAHGFARVAACTIVSSPADPAANARAILEEARLCHEAGAVLCVFPELSVSAYAIDDLLLQDVLLDGVLAALETIAEGSRDLTPILLVGAPLLQGARLYNCAVVIHKGRILGVVPKVHLPNYREFYEKRHFASGMGTEGQTIRLAGAELPFGSDLLFAAEDLPGFVLHVEICEDVWVPVPPSSQGALAGATILANLSASNITIGKAGTRNQLSASQSGRCQAAYLYAAAGAGESTTDLAWDGQASIFELGETLAETERFPLGAQRAMADVDLDRLRQERLRMGSFDDNGRSLGIAPDQFRRIPLRLDPPDRDLGLQRPLQRFPFVPAAPARLDQDCYEGYNIQIAGLIQRLRGIGLPKMVIGISGGLDSTHALIVAARAADQLEIPRQNILAYTMPGFATSDETKRNAIRLMEALGVTWAELDIRPAARQMLSDIGHPFHQGAPVYDVTFENVQAGLRTDYLFRLANHQGAIVLGTGDLSELALGWCTYGVGDQMSHYNVNGGIPKTLIQHLIRWVARTGQFSDAVGAVLLDILNTEISPELVPAAPGEKPQSTEAKIGPYALQDFTLFHVLRYGFRPSKIAFLALMAWEDAASGPWPPGYPEDLRPAYALPEIKHWMRVFLQRFFAFSQFKRSAMPNGPKVSAGGSLSPRGDWRAPSDGNARVWLEELETGVPDARGTPSGHLS